MTSAPSVDASVVVASRNRPALLCQLVASLAATDPRPAEVILVDDASDVPVDALVHADAVPFRLRVLRNAAAVGPG